MFSCVPGARRAARGSRRVGRGVSATCPCWSVPSSYGCICGVCNARRAIIGPGSRVSPSASRRNGPSASPTTCDRNTYEVARAEHSPDALVSLHARSVVGPSNGVVVDAPESSAAPSALMHTLGARGTATIRGSSTEIQASPSPRFRAGVPTRSSPGSRAVLKTNSIGLKWLSEICPRPFWRPSPRSLATRCTSSTASTSSSRR